MEKSTAYRLKKYKKIAKNIKIYDKDDNNLIAFKIDNESEKMFVIYNASEGSRAVKIPAGKWKVYANGGYASDKPNSVIKGGEVIIPAHTELVIGKTNYDKLRNLLIVSGVAVAGIITVAYIMSDEERAETVKKEAELAKKNVIKFSEDMMKKLPAEVTLDDILDMCVDGKNFLANAVKFAK